MAKYLTTGSDDCEPGSNGMVLKNLLGIQDPVEMGQLEYAALVEAQSELLEVIQMDTVLTVDMILEMHERWLGGIYTFAGALRTVDLTAPPQGDVPEFRFSHAAYLVSNLATFDTNQLSRYTPCDEKDLDRLALQLAEVQSEFIMIHPFREGNGRIARLITDIMALQANRPILDYDFEGERGEQNRAAYYLAMHKALKSVELGPLAEIMKQAILRAE